MAFRVKKLYYMFRQALPFGLAGMLLLIYLQIPIVMLSMVKSKAEVGLFSAAFKLIAALYFIPRIISSVVYPILFQLGARDLDRHKRTYVTLFRFLSSFGLPISLALFLLAEPIIYFLFGAEFKGTINILRVLSWLFALQCMSYPLADALTTADFQWHRTFMHGITAGLCLIFCSFLIPQYGAFGAGLAILFTEFITLCGYQFLTCSLLKGDIIVSKNPIAWLATLIMGIIIFVLMSKLNFLIVLAIGMLTYLLILLTIDRKLASEFSLIVKRLRE
jgi:O-antigen/teichoic acid export membrane protein